MKKELVNGFTRNVSVTSDKITHARTKMNATELKAFYQISTLVDMDDTDFNEYKISVKDFCDSLNINSTNRDFVVKTCKKLIRQVFELEQPDGDYLGYTIFSKMHYKHKEQSITFSFNNDMKPFLLELKKQFTYIRNVEYLKKFDSKYAIRIYAMLKNYRLMSEMSLNIDELIKMFQLPKSYTDFNFINKKVLEPAKTEINEKSDLEIYEIEKIKTGRKITDIKIHFGNKGDKQAQDIIKHLRKRLKQTNTYDSFINYNFFFTQSDTQLTTRSQLKRITYIKIERIAQGLYYTILSNNSTLYATADKREFDTVLFQGIYNAAKFEVEQQKSLKLDLDSFQFEKDKINEIKKLLNIDLNDKK